MGLGWVALPMSVRIHGFGGRSARERDSIVSGGRTAHVG